MHIGLNLQPTTSSKLCLLCFLSDTIALHAIRLLLSVIQISQLDGNKALGTHAMQHTIVNIQGVHSQILGQDCRRSREFAEHRQ